MVTRDSGLGDSGLATRKTYHRGNVAQDLRKAAEHILTTERLEDVTVRRLTREIGVTPANFYNHYDSTETLLLDIAATAFGELDEGLRKIVGQGGSRLDILVRAAQGFVRYTLARPQLIRLMFGSPGRGADHDRFRTASYSVFRALVIVAYGEDRFDPADSCSSHRECPVAYGLFALMVGLAQTVGAGQINVDLHDPVAVDLFVEQTVRPFLSGALNCA